jgi:serine/threonine protein kinase
MGRVYLGRSADGRLVAVKVVHAGLAADSGFRALFRQEVAVAQKVNGLYTAQVVDADVDGLVPWLATAYVAGPSLNEAVDSHGPLPAASVRALAAGLAEGLSAIHAAGLVHCDLKPSNVLLADDGPRVVDFGLARAAEASVLTQEGMVVGSAGYMSPEQVTGQHVGPPSDVFSLGAVLTFAATGRSPFGDGNSVTLLYRVMHSPPDLDGVPAEILDLVRRCLTKDPGERPTAADLLAKLGHTDLAEGWLPTRGIGRVPGFAPPAVTAPARGGHRAPVQDRGRVPDELVASYPRPARWFCIYCGWECTESFNDYVCKSCGQLRPGAGGSATMRSCSKCKQWSLAIAKYCEWCGNQLGPL